MRPNDFHHALRMTAAWVDSSERLWRCFVTVKPACEKSLSMSTDVAVNEISVC